MTRLFAKVLIVVLAVVFLSSAVVFAEKLQLGKKPIYVVKTKVTMKMDAKTSEAAWKKAPNVASSINHYIVTATGAVKTGSPPDGTKVTTLKYLWDAKNLYCFIKVKDPQNYTGSISPTDFDSVQYSIDAKNCNKSTYNGKCDASYTLSRPFKRANGQPYSEVWGWGETVQMAAFKKNSKSIGTASNYTQEVKIVMSLHGVATLKAKKKIGWDMQINDATVAKAGRTYQLVWNSLDYAWVNPSTMGTLILK